MVVRDEDPEARRRSSRAKREQRADAGSAVEAGPRETFPPSSSARSRMDVIPTPGRYSAGTPAAVVGDLDDQAAVQRDVDVARVRTGMANGVRDRLERDAVRGDLDGCRKRGDVVGDADVDPEIVARRSAGRPARATRRRGRARRAQAGAGRRQAGGCPRQRPACHAARAPGGEQRQRDRVARRFSAASTSSAAPASAGPSPSWRSRRSLRRSSSRAATRRSRARWSSAASGAKASTRRPRSPVGPSTPWVSRFTRRCSIDRSGCTRRAANPVATSASQKSALSWKKALRAPTIAT